MNESLAHSYANFRLHLYQAVTRNRAHMLASHVKKFFDVADKAGKIALAITIAYLAIACFEKLAASVTLSAHYCDLCAVLPVMLAAP